MKLYTTDYSLFITFICFFVAIISSQNYLTVVTAAKIISTNQTHYSIAGKF